MTYRTLFLQDLAELKSTRGNDAGNVMAFVLGIETTSRDRIIAFTWHDKSVEVGDDMGIVAPITGNTDMGRWHRVWINTINADWNAVDGPALILNKPVPLQGPVGATGATGAQGVMGLPGPTAVSAPTSRILSLATAYQAADITKPAIITVSLQATSSISLGGAVNNEGTIVIGPTSAVASGTGTPIGVYKNNLGGTLVIGLNLNTTQTNSYHIPLPVGWYFAIRQTVGSGLTINSSYDQSLG